MNRLIGLFLVMIFVVACRHSVEAPKNLLSKEEMAQIVADFAVYTQSSDFTRNVDMEEVSRFVMNKNKAKGKAFEDSFKYYLYKPSDVDKIYDMAQDILLKDSDLEEYIKKKEAENKNQNKEEKVNAGDLQQQ
ncbi:DUF4296 domain-containing protein [Riemerella anatipestifer]|nr:DUF4296 domain-containing protein [Riemerella anatipestifer]MDY3344947.1 DUF4296 domain-containing protein [Riemerella anatipestifer]MDY3357906.1 DUF4296 domain-containing protein [Riemerella anatipestifer]